MNKQMKWGAILQYSQIGINILVNIIYTPIMIRILGSSEYGIYNIASSLIAYLNLLSLGFSSSYIRFYSISKNSKDKKAVHKLNATYLIVFLVIGFIALVCGFFVSANVELFFNNTYSIKEVEIARKLMLILAINLSITFPASLFISYISSQERFIFQKIVNMGKTILSPCLSIAFLLLGFGSIGMALSLTFVSMVVDCINIIFCLRKLDMQFCFHNLDFSILKQIASFSIFIAINQIVDQINWQTDKIVLGKMTNSSVVAVYAVASTINGLYLSFAASVTNVFTPRVHKIENSGAADKDEKLNDIFVLVGRIQFFVLMLVLTGFIFFGKYFIVIWAGKEFVDAYYVVLLLIWPVTIPLLQNMGIEIQRAKNKHQFRSVAYLIMAVLNVIISIILCRDYGVFGVAFGTTLSLLIANGLIMNIYYNHIGINVIDFWKSIFKLLPCLIAPVILGIFIKNTIRYRNSLEFICAIAIYSVVYLMSIYFLGLNSEEKKQSKEKY